MDKQSTIELRLVHESDAELILSWENDREVWPVTGTRYEYSLQDIHTYIEQSQNINEFGQIRFIIVDSDSKKDIGTIDLYDYSIDNKRAAIGVLIAEKEFRGKGCAKQAVNLIEKYATETLDLYNIYCSVQSNNQASLALFDSCKFNRVGLREKWYRIDGELIDEILFQKWLKKD